MDYDLPTEFDLIVVGTGVIESIVSAAASRIGKRVLHVDTNNYYGGHWASFNLEDIQQNLQGSNSIEETTFIPDELGSKTRFVKFNKDLRSLKNVEIKWNVSNEEQAPIEQEEGKENENELKVEEKVGPITMDQLKKDYRKFVIDLCPKINFTRGDFVELLITSNIARYAEFRCVSRVLTWLNGNLEVVPCSRSDVFANNKVSVVEKRMLMKLLTSIDKDEKDPSVPDTTTYKEFLKGKKLSNNIIHFVLYALSMSTDLTPWTDGLKSTKRFLNSLGRFGKTPFLFSMYGSGEITQAFCRLSAVFGGIFALNQPLNGFLVDDDNKFSYLLCGKQKISAAHLVMDVGMAPRHFLKDYEPKYISRAVFITDKSLMSSESEHLTLLLYPGDDRLIVVLEMGCLTGTCPKNLFLVHLTTKGILSPKEDFANCVKDLFESEDNFEKPNILWSCYFHIPETNAMEPSDSKPCNVQLCSGPDLDVDFDHAVEKAKEIFNLIYPNEEFLPRAPDADEIVIEGETEAATEVKESSNEETEESANVDECLEVEENGKQI